MDTTNILPILAVIVALVEGYRAIIYIYKQITGAHDQVQKWDDYDRQIAEVKTTIQENQSDTTAKIQQIQAEQCMQTYVLEAVLDGLHQLNCNGKVTEASEALHKHINKQAHGQEIK